MMWLAYSSCKDATDEENADCTSLYTFRTLHDSEMEEQGGPIRRELVIPVDDTPVCSPVT